ncbi:MAG: UDP-N-acetylglucosamine 2-epimerase (non-hydrolyzing) [Burkholderiales bacterium]|nr:MAG: UDP-N-acetylglucosamine 2-epimerase (non-hydrolyzing) [Burkholderiales bacterium]
MSARVVHLVGARPQFPKLGVVLRAQLAAGDGEPLVVHTGQHYDPAMSDAFFAELGLPAPVAALGIGSGPHGRQTGRMLEAIEETLLGLRPDAVVVYGDTNSTLAGALAATKLGVPCAHVEAGLRSFDRSMPEELNRVAVDHLCDLLFAPTETARERLLVEGLGERTVLSGDVSAEAVLHAERIAASQSRILETLGLAPRRYAVATLHRAESTRPEVLPGLLHALATAARRLGTLVLPLHPRTTGAIAAIAPGWPETAAAAGVRIVEPLGPLDFLRLTGDASMVLTDSGGVQKEAFLLGVPCVTLRGTTEWVETVDCGANALATDAGTVDAAIGRHLAANHDRDALRARALDLYGGGRAGARIAEGIRTLSKEGRT